MRGLLVFLLLTLFGRGASPLNILVSIDGCRWDYPELHGAAFLQELSREGVRLERLIPSFPTKTFPNHYTLVTGLRPQNHGIIQNRFWDDEFQAWFGIGNHPAAREGRWWGGEPIWLTAQRQGRQVACMFWPGSEANIGGRFPKWWRRYDGSISHADRVQQVLDWAALPQSDRPDLITLYFSAVDTMGHSFGPNSLETGRALRDIDRALVGLKNGLIQLDQWSNTNLIVTADHGMTEVVEKRALVLEDLVSLKDVRVIFSGASIGLDVVRGSADDLVAGINHAGQPVTAFTRDDVPAEFHFSNNPRIPDIVLIPELGWTVRTRRQLADKNWESSAGDHGFDHREPDMGAILIAHGPAFPRGLRLPAMDNIHVYPLLCELLGIVPAPCDGDDRLIEAALR